MIARKTLIPPVFFAFFVLVPAAAVVAIRGCDKRSSAPADTVTINGHTWRVELATTDQARHKGLGGRASLPQNHGMLFVFREAKPLDFYMLNCRMAIDIAYIGADGKVIRTWTMQPQPGVAEEDLKLYPSVEPARFALELAKDDLVRAGVAPGQKVQFSPGIDPTKAQP
jgi:uncharacterized membrane protein (UPF0127 family)